MTQATAYPEDNNNHEINLPATASGLVLVDSTSADHGSQSDGEARYDFNGNQKPLGFMFKFQQLVDLLRDNNFDFIQENVLQNGNYTVEIRETRTPSKENGEFDNPDFDELEYFGIIHAVNQKIGNQQIHFFPTNMNDLLSKLMLTMGKMRISFKQNQELGALPKASAVVKITDDTMVLRQFQHGLSGTLFINDED